MKFACLFCWTLIPLRADQVRYLGSVANLETTYYLLRNPIGLGDAPMQPQMFEPGIGEKGLNEATVVGRVLEYAPVVSAVATAFARVLTERLEKRAPVLWINTVFHGYQNRAPIGFDGMSGDRIWPLHGRRKIDIRPCL